MFVEIKCRVTLNKCNGSQNLNIHLPMYVHNWSVIWFLFCSGVFQKMAFTFVISNVLSITTFNHLRKIYYLFISK